MHIAFVSPALAPEHKEDQESFDFFAILLAGIVRQAQMNDHRVSVYIPKKEASDRSNQRDVLSKVLREDNFDAIVIAPFDTASVVDELIGYLDRKARKEGGSDGIHDLRKVVLIDKSIDLTTLKSHIRGTSIRVKNICCDNRKGGAVAASILIDTLASREVPPLKRRFMVLTGLEGSEERVEGFQKAILKSYPDIAVTAPLSDNLNFTRAGARSWMSEQLRSLNKGDTSDFGTLDDDCAWGIFCCNDEMALGARAVISSFYQVVRERIAIGTVQGRRRHRDDLSIDYRMLLFLQDVIIVGFDGISPALDLIRPGMGHPDYPVKDPWLVGTIRAQIDQQTEEAIKWVQNSGTLDGPTMVDVESIRA